MYIAAITIKPITFSRVKSCVKTEVMGQPLMGMYVESCDVDAAHPVGRKYERRRIPDNRQCVWKDVMYWWPFPDKEADKLLVFKNNERWQ